jgi:hypothetical protein
MYLVGYTVRSVNLGPPPLQNPDAKYRKTATVVSPPTFMQRALGLNVYGYCCPSPDRRDVDTAIHGIQTRLSRLVPKSSTEWRRIRSFARMFCRKFLEPVTDLEIPSAWEYIQTRDAPQWRKDQLWKNYTTSPYYPGPPRKTINKCFIKTECYEEYKPARGIYSRDDYSKVYFGRYIHALEQKVFKLGWFIKKIPVKERSRYIVENVYMNGCKYIATDYSKFESQFTPEVIRCVEGQLYKYMLANHSDIADQFTAILSGINVCKFKGFTCRIPGKRMSGELSTSVGNGFTNLIIMQYYAWNHNNKNLYAGVVEGDDGLFRIEGNTPPASYFEDLGLTIKLIEHDDICEASFCGIISDFEAQQNVRDPRSIMVKLGYTMSSKLHGNQMTLRGLLRAKCFSLAYELPGCPIVSALAKRGLYLTSTYQGKIVQPIFEEGYWQRYLRSLWGKLEFEEINPKTRDLVSKKYGIPIETQLAVEKRIENLDLGPIIDPIILDFISTHNKSGIWNDYWSRFHYFERNDSILY